MARVEEEAQGRASKRTTSSARSRGTPVTCVQQDHEWRALKRHTNDARQTGPQVARPEEDKRNMSTGPKT